jgi:hypothetical protein
VSVQAGKDVLKVFDGERDATYAQRVRRCVFRFSADHRRRVENSRFWSLQRPTTVRASNRENPCYISRIAVSRWVPPAGFEPATHGLGRRYGAFGNVRRVHECRQNGQRCTGTFSRSHAVAARGGHGNQAKSRPAPRRRAGCVRPIRTLSPLTMRGQPAVRFACRLSGSARCRYVSCGQRPGASERSAMRRPSCRFAEPSREGFGEPGPCPVAYPGHVAIGPNQDSDGGGDGSDDG